MEALVAELRERTAQVAPGGGEKAIERHRSRGKLPARERIDRLVDPGTAFLELERARRLGALRRRRRRRPGIVTGIGVVEGRECVIVANDATVKGGSYFPLTVKKHLRAQEVAEQNRLPCLYLVDSGGAFLPLQAEVFPDRDHFGRIFFNQARMSAQGIPQIAVVMGSCTAGGAYVPAMSDETVIVRGTGTIFIGGPPLVKAATGQDVTAEELGGADVHTRQSGVADHYATSRRARARDRAADRRATSHGRKPTPPWERAEPEPPVADPAELYGLDPGGLPHAARRARGDRAHRRRLALRRVQGALRRDARLRLRADRGLPGRRSSRTTASSSPSRRRRARTSSSSRASARVPLVFLQNITGFMVGKEYEAGGIARDGAKLVMAVACAEVPKFTVVIGGSFGAGNYAMCGRAYEPRQLWMWPNARISVMGGEQAATVLTMVGDADPDEIRAKYEARGQPVLLDRAALGRRHHRPARHAPRARARHLRRAERADSRDDVRRLPDVSLVRIVLWRPRADSETTIERARGRYLGDETVDEFAEVARGCASKRGSRTRPATAGARVYLYESRSEADSEPPSRVDEMIGMSRTSWRRSTSRQTVEGRGARRDLADCGLALE